MTDWGEYLACTGCHARMGQACYALSSGGPEALPPVYLDEPHRKRKLRSATTTATRVAPTAKKGAGPQRRRAENTASVADAWRALADRKR